MPEVHLKDHFFPGSPQAQDAALRQYIGKLIAEVDMLRARVEALENVSLRHDEFGYLHPAPLVRADRNGVASR